MAAATAAAREQVLAFRLHRLHLDRPLAPGSLPAAAAACAVQNTPPGSAVLALHARTAGLTPQAFDHVLDPHRTLLQAWSVRGTPHLFPTADLAVYTTALAPADEAAARFLLRPILDDLDALAMPATVAVARTAAAVGEALEGGIRTKDELLEDLARRLPKGLNPWCSRCAMHHVHPSLQRAAALLGGFLLVPRAGPEAAFVRTDNWLPGPGPGSEPAPPAARAELVRRYLRCYGPATAAGAGWGRRRDLAGAQAPGPAGADRRPVRPAYSGRSGGDWRRG